VKYPKLQENITKFNGIPLQIQPPKSFSGYTSNNN